MLGHYLVPRRSALRARSEFDRFLDDFLGSFDIGRPARFEPRIDVRDEEKEVTLRAELPGLEDKDFEVSVEADVVSLKGEKHSEQAQKREGYSHVESHYGSFHRSLRLPWEVDAEAVRASYKDGVLTVTIPKPAEETPERRTIPVNA